MAQHDYDLADALGANFRADANLALQAIVTNNSGATAPATTFPYMVWADTTSGTLKIRNGANNAWYVIGNLDALNLGLMSLIGGTLTGALTMSGAAINEAQAGNVASSATINLDTATGNLVDVTGTTNITAVTLSQGRERLVRFTGALKISNGGSLILQGGADINTSAGDYMLFRGYASGVVRAIYLPLGGYVQPGSNRAGSVNGFLNPGISTCLSNVVSGTVTAGAAAYVTDGWMVSCTGANVPWGQFKDTALISTAPGYFTLFAALSATACNFIQRIEAAECAEYIGARVTIQGYFANNTANTISPTLTVKNATAANNFGATTTQVNAQALGSIGAGQGSVLAYTFDASVNSGLGLEITFGLGGGLNVASGNISMTAFDIRVSPNAALGINAAPPVPEMPFITADEMRAERYNPCFDLKGASNPIVWPGGQCYSTTLASFVFNFRVRPFVKPTGATISAATDFGLFSATGAVIALTALAFNSSTDRGSTLTATVASGMVAGNATQLISRSSTSGSISLTGCRL